MTTQHRHKRRLLRPSALLFLLIVAALAASLSQGNRAHGAPITVPSTVDSGVGSLPQAILDSNASVGVGETIGFNIPPGADPGCAAGTGACTKLLATVLPATSDPVMSPGNSKTGTPLQDGSKLECTECSDTTIINNVISAIGTAERVFHAGIFIFRPAGVTLQGNYIGADVTGTMGTGNAIGGNAVQNIPPVITEPAEAIASADSLQIFPPVMIELAEATGTGDSVQIIAPSPVIIALTEAIGTGDSVQIIPLPPVIIELAEAIGAGDSVQVIPAPQLPDLTLTKSDSPDPVIAGSDLTNTLVATNASTGSAATGVFLIDELPADVIPVSVTTTQGTCSADAGVITCDLGTLEPVASATVEIVVTPTAAGEITNTASVGSDLGDANPDDNSATTVTTVMPSPLSLVGPFPGVAGEDNTFGASGATPGETVRIIAGTEAGLLDIPGCPGTTIDFANPRLLGTAVANLDGNAALTVAVPLEAAGKTAGFYAVEQSNCRVSNLVVHTFE